MLCRFNLHLSRLRDSATSTISDKGGKSEECLCPGTNFGCGFTITSGRKTVYYLIVYSVYSLYSNATNESQMYLSYTSGMPPL